MKNYKMIKFVLWFILIINLIVAFTKVSIGYFFHINSLAADGLHAISDSASNVVGLIAIHFASRPADNGHPYGHYKYEIIASLIIGVMLFIIGIQNLFRAVNWFFNPVIPTISLAGLIALVITLFINVFVAIYEYQKGKKLNSNILISDSMHTKTDIFISLSVIITVILIKAGIPIIIDPILTIIITIIIFHSCYGIFRKNIGDLVDQKAIEEKIISDIIYGIDSDIVNIHKIRSRGFNDNIYIDLHIIVPPQKTVEDAHELSHKIEETLREKLNKKVDLVAHIEPNEM